MFNLTDEISSQPELMPTYFQPDKRKPGGAYVAVSGRLKNRRPRGDADPGGWKTDLDRRHSHDISENARREREIC